MGASWVLALSCPLDSPSYPLAGCEGVHYVIFLSTPVVLGFVLAKLVSQALAGNVNSGQHVVKGKLYPISLCGWGNSYMLKRLSWLRPC